MKIALMFALIILAVALGPLFLIWSLNTLFPVLAIPYTIKTWAAVVLVKGLVSVQATK